MADESISTDNWIVATLGGDAALQALIGNPARVFPGLAPQGAATPYVVYAELSDVDSNSMGMARATARAVYQVKVVGTPPGALKPIRSRIDDLLHGQSVLLADCALKCARTGRARAVEFVNSVRYDSLIGLYSVTAQPYSAS